MSGRVGHRKRLICVSSANIRQNHLYLTGHADFFPADCFGPSSSKKGTGKLLTLDVVGLNDPVLTDIPCDASTGKPRRFFRRRAWVGAFFTKHRVQPGDVIVIERISTHSYRVGPFEVQGEREHSGILHFGEVPDGDGPTIIELFAGCGGLAAGFKDAGFRTVVANEWDTEACDTLRANITDRVLNCAIQEIQSFPPADVVVGGPPCQGFSNLGERVPNDPRSQLWRQYMRCIDQVRPKVFLLENVPPLLRSAEYQELRQLAESYGYAVDARVLNAADYGVPQQRKRAIVIGSRVGAPSFPEPTHVDPAKQDLLSAQLAPWRTVRDAIGHMPLAPTERNWHIGRNPTPKSLERYRCIPPGGNRWDLPPHLMPECWKRKTKGGTDLFGRLWWDRPSVTIRTEFYKPEKGRYLHPVADRAITHREAALLQSFPEDHTFCGKRINVGIQIGNAVPPILASCLARHIAGILGDAVQGQTLKFG